MGTSAFRRAVLTGKSRFDKLFKEGRRFHGRNVSVICLMVAENEPARMAVCVRKGIGSAPVRNRLKRVVREAAEPFVPALKQGVWIGIMPNAGYEASSAPERRRSLGLVLSRAGLLPKGTESDDSAVLRNQN
ncbi:MAG: ribonuclease P protein component [Spirochaetia bacterium]|nr:ribonuclease P protein component [Spirochaetia bacterium]